MRLFHLRPHSFGTTVIWDHSHLKSVQVRPQSFETTLIWGHIHLRLLHLRQHSFETTLIWDYIHLRSLGQPKVNKVKIALPFLKFTKRWQTKFHADTKLLGQKNLKYFIRSNFIVRSLFSCSTVFFSLQIFYWNYNNRYWYAFAKFSCNSVIIVGLMRFPTRKVVLPTTWRLNIRVCRIGEKYGRTVLVLVNAQSIMHLLYCFSFMMFSGLTLL